MQAEVDRLQVDLDASQVLAARLHASAADKMLTDHVPSNVQPGTKAELVATSAQLVEQCMTNLRLRIVGQVKMQSVVNSLEAQLADHRESTTREPGIQLPAGDKALELDDPKSGWTRSNSNVSHFARMSVDSVVNQSVRETYARTYSPESPVNSGAANFARESIDSSVCAGLPEWDQEDSFTYLSPPLISSGEGPGIARHMLPISAERQLASAAIVEQTLRTELQNALSNAASVEQGLKTELQQAMLTVESLTLEMQHMNILARSDTASPQEIPADLDQQLDAQLAQNKAGKIFNSLDRNGEGALSHSEMKKVLQKDKILRVELGARSWKTFFELLGTDGDFLCLISVH